jgi:hypothetical protein
MAKTEIQTILDSNEKMYNKANALGRQKAPLVRRFAFCHR